MMLSDKEGLQQIVMALAALGLQEVVIAPGSRNAPLVISFHRHPTFHCTSIRDERSAAFFALGKAMELSRPVAVICTSGSAPLNFAPAIAEAYYQRIPLLVITADRPKAWTDQGDGQTINQTDIYRNYIRGSYELKGDASLPADLWFNERCISEGFNKATLSNPGPVHFNIPMDEPLYRTSAIRHQQPKVFREETIECQLPEETQQLLAHQFSTTKRIMILVGQQSSSLRLQKVLSKTASLKQVVVLAESTSNIHNHQFVENIDRCLTGVEDSEIKKLMPDLLITVGSAIVSKRIKKFLREHRPNSHWNIHPFDATMDTYQSLTNAIAMNPSDFFEQLQEHTVSLPSDYRSQWLQLKEEKELRHQDFCRSCTYSDFKVFFKIYETMPAQTYLHLSNSSPVRYAQLFDNTKIAATYSNRGTSGIDGCSSTAMGTAAAAPHKNFLLITGDIAFHYDSHALWNDTAVRNLKIIVINNGGGGIFRIIDGPNQIEERATFLETAMEMTAEHVALQYHWKYLSAKNEEELDTTLSIFFSSATERTILEIFTPAAQNPEVLKAYWNHLNKKKS